VDEYKKTSLHNENEEDFINFRSIVSPIPRPSPPPQNRMRLHPALIVLAVSVAAIVFYSKNPALSSSNFRHEFKEDSPPRSTSLKSISTSASNSSVVHRDHDSSLPGLHLCTCLNVASAVDDTDAETPKRIRWLHFPKTGTSFISTLWSYACSTRERYIDLEISSFQCDIFAKNYFSMYDFALMR